MEHQTGLEMYCIVDEKNKKLRYGYTTGSCAAAAAQAAVRMLLSGEKTEEVALQTPKGILLHLLIEEIQMSREEVVCAVKKDGGDDPDVTHGIFVYARVKKSKEPGVHLDGHHSHAEGLLAVRHRAGHRGFQSGLPGIQLQRS